MIKTNKIDFSSYTFDVAPNLSVWSVLFPHKLKYNVSKTQKFKNGEFVVDFDIKGNVIGIEWIGK